MTTVIFVRHGQSEANLTRHCAYQLDSPLTELGRRQALCTAEFLKNMPMTAVYASDLSRAFDTGEIIANCHGLKVTSDTALREIYGGVWEGMPYADIAVSYAEDYRRWIETIGLSAPTGGETVAALQQRVQTAVASIVKEHPQETVCVATHATPIRVLECLWTGTPLSLMHTIPWVSNASITVAQYSSPLNGKLVSRDAHAHLQDLMTKFPSNI